MKRDNRQALDLDSLDLVTGGVAGSQAPTPKINVNMHDLLDPFYGTNHAGAASAFTLEIPLMGAGAMGGMPQAPAAMPPVAEAASAPVTVKVCGNSSHASPATAEVDTLSDAEQAKAEMDAAHAQGLSQAEAALAALEADGGCGDEEPAAEAQAEDDDGGCGGDGSGAGDGSGGGCGDADEAQDADEDPATYADEEVPAEEPPVEEDPAAEPPVMQCGDGSPSSVGDDPADEYASAASVPNAVWVGTGAEQSDDGENVMHTQVEDSVADPQVIGEYAETASVPDAQWVGYEGDDAQVALEGQSASVTDAQWVGYEQEDVSGSVPGAVWADSSAEPSDDQASDDEWDLSQVGEDVDQALEDNGVNLPIDFGDLGATVEGTGNDKSAGISKEDIMAGINSAIRG